MTEPHSPSVVSRRAVDDARPTPNLFIVGAPKSGTTALASYLSAHRDVFVADKELSFFGSDLEFRTKRGRWRIGYDTYLEWFAPGSQARYRTDRSVFYLYSSCAADEIHAYDPTARIIALLRNPVDQMHSQHSEMLFQGEEVVASFEKAIGLEEQRKRGDSVPPGCQKVFGLFYRDIARYAEQVERYFSVFGRDRVCVVLHDDLVRDSARAYRTVLGFLDVDPDHRPEFNVVNANKVVRSPRVRDLLGQSPSGLRRLGRALVPDEQRRASLRRRLHALNTDRRPRPPMDVELHRRLTAEFAPEIRRLEQLLDRDLGGWLTGGPPGQHPGVASDRPVR